MKKILSIIGIVSLFIGCSMKDIKSTPHSVTDMMGNIQVAGWKTTHKENNRTK